MIVTVTDELIVAWLPDLPATTRVSQVTLRLGQSPLPPPYAMFPAGRTEAPDLGVAVLTSRPPAGESMSLIDDLGTEHHAVAMAGQRLDDLLARIGPAGRVALLALLLDSVPRFFRQNGQALATAVRRVVDATGVRECHATAAFSLGEDQSLVRCVVPTPAAASTHYRIGSDGVRPEPGPIDPGGHGSHWVVSGIGNSPAPDLLIGIAGVVTWRLRLDELRPKPTGAFLRHLGDLTPEAAEAVVEALRRWEARRPTRSARISAIVQDCIAFYSGGGERRAAGRFDYCIDALVPVPGGGVLVSGWMFDPHERARGLDAVDCTGKRIPVPALWPVPHAAAAERWRDSGFPVPERAGFVGFAEGGADGPWGIDIALKTGTLVEATVPPTIPDPRRARDQLLTSLPASAEIDGAIVQAIAPAVERLHAAHMARHPVGTRVRSGLLIGERRPTPRASIIVPLYRNLNFLTFQCAAFGADSGLTDVEIVYVLDSPEQAEYLEGRLRGEHLIHRTPMTMVVHSTNLGFAAAVNTGARMASGADLVFLNSDVIPERPGWLEPLLAGLALPGIGATGPQLLYLDDSLQFAGLYFDRDADGVWFNRHVTKGYPRSHPAANVARQVPALTGACLAMRRSVFERVGGFDESYVIGDFEDSDLCLRLLAEGLACWYEPSSVLYHVERQSIDRHEAHGKSVATMINRWRQQQRWHGSIETLMADRETRWGLPASLMPKIERVTDILWK